MRTHYENRICRFLRYGSALAILMAGPALFFWINPAVLSNNAINDSSVSRQAVPDTSGWMNQVIKDITEKEYNIVWNSRDSVYKSPNRSQDFRVVYDPRKVHFQPRIQETSPAKNWSLDLTLQQIQFDEHGSFFPVHNAIPDLEKNKISFNHQNQFSVEYVNAQNGLRQNFIIHKMPAEVVQTITVKLQIGGMAKASKRNEQEVYFSMGNDQPGDMNLVYNDLLVWDADGNKLKAWMDVPDASTIEIKVDAAHASLPITIDPLTTSAFDWVAYGSANGDKLGTALSGAGDVNNDGYSDIMIATTKYDGTYTDEGAVYIYHGSANGLGNTAATVLTGAVATGQGASNFGASVSAAGDINGDGYSDIVIGAPDNDNGGTNRGAAFIFYGSNTGIAATGFTTLTGLNTNDNFGISVAGAGDVNGDRYSDIIVGAQGFDVAIANDERGAAFIYFGSNTGIASGSSPSQTLPGPDVAGETGTWYFNNPDLFGAVVAGAGDVNADGYSDVLVSATQYEQGIGDNTSDDRDEGAVYVYHGSATGVNTTAAIVLEGNRDQVKFGVSIGTAGDVNGDGYSEIVVSAPDFSIYPGNGGTVPQYGGAVFIFSGSAAGITGQVLNASVTGATLYGSVSFQRFGTSVRCAGDVNGDGFADVIIGATTYDNNRAANGTASGGILGNTFIFYGRGGLLGGFIASVNTMSMLNIQSTQTAAEFGGAVASAGDINGDGFSDVLVGAFDYDNGAVTNAGAVFAFNGGGFGLSYTPVTMKERNQVNSNLGISVSSAGDINGDGLGDVVIGANLWDNGAAINCGAVFVYHGLNNGGINNFSTPASPLLGTAGSNFGMAVSNAGDVNGDGYSDIIVGANLAGAGSTGAAYVYHGSAAGVLVTPATTLMGTSAGDNFGVAVSSAGDVNWDGYSDIIIGANQYESSVAETNEGAAFVYYGSNTGINTAISRRVEINQAYANFGIAVAHAGDVNQDGWSDIVIGADQYDNGQTDEGAAFVFHGSLAGIATVAATRIESDQAGARLGASVSYAGDVNGDSYSDIIAGAYLYDNAQTDAGAAFIYHGATGGLHTIPAAVLQGVNANDHFGVSVSTAGDINGDGYDDVIAGAHLYDNGQVDEGGAFVYHGSNIGVSSIPDIILEGNQASGNFGISVAGAGDLNGDGFADAIAGANNYNGGQAGEGRIFIHLGNNKTTGAMVVNRPKSRNTASSSFITATNLADLNFGIELFARSYLGAHRGKMLWEIRGSGSAWSSGPAGRVSNSLGFTMEQSAYVPLTQNGPSVVFAETAGKVLSPTYGLSRARMRLKYDMITSLTGQVYGPWRYIDRYGAALIAAQPVQPIVLSEAITSFHAIIDQCTITLHWQSSHEAWVKEFVIESSVDGQSFSTIAQVNASANMDDIPHYSAVIKQENTIHCYRLKTILQNGEIKYSRHIWVHSNCRTLQQVSAYPNPVKKGSNLSIRLGANVSYDSNITVYLTDMAGKKFLAGQFNLSRSSLSQLSINTDRFERGVYVLEITGISHKEHPILVIID